MTDRRKLGRPRAAGDGAPGGVSTCSQLSQLTRVSHPNSLLGAVTRLALCYTQTSSPLTIPVLEHHPAGAPAWEPSACTTTSPQGNGYHNPPAPPQTPGEGRKRSQPPPREGQSIPLHLSREREEGPAAGASGCTELSAPSCQSPNPLAAR